MTYSRRSSIAAIIAALAALLLVLAACGDDDNGDGGPTGAPTITEAGESPRETVDGSPVETPGGSPGGPVTCTEADQQRGLLSELDFGGEDGVFDPGEEITFNLTLINCGDNDVTLTFPSTQRYVLTIATEPGGVEVYNSAEDQAFAPVEGEEVIKPNESVVYTETWDQKDRDGEQVPEGRYKVSMLSVGCGSVQAQDCRFGPIKYIQIGQAATGEATEEPEEETETPEAS